MYRSVSNSIEVYRTCIVIFDIHLSIQYRDTFCSIHVRYKHDTFLAPSGLRYCIVFRYHFDTHTIHLGYCIVISDRYIVVSDLLHGGLLALWGAGSVARATLPWVPACLMDTDTDRCVYVDAIHCIVRVSHMYRECIGKHYACIELSDT